jgi:hypothetical protein
VPTRPANACWRSAVARPYKVRRGFRTPCNIFSDPDTACEKHLPQARATPHDPRASARTKYTSRHALQPPDSATSPGPSRHSATPERPPDDDHAFWSPEVMGRTAQSLIVTSTTRAACERQRPRCQFAVPPLPRAWVHQRRTRLTLLYSRYCPNRLLLSCTHFRKHLAPVSNDPSLLSSAASARWSSTKRLA